MVRGKVQLRRIANETRRQVTFCKRRNGLLKKAYELSVLCDSEVALIIFSQKGRLCEFASSDMEKTIERYRESANEKQTNNSEIQEHFLHLQQETSILRKKIERLEVSRRELLGQDLGSYSVEELHEIGSQQEQSLKKIRAREVQLFKDQIEQLEAKNFLFEENARLNEQCAMKPRQTPAEPKEILRSSQRRQNYSEVETGLFIGRSA